MKYLTSITILAVMILISSCNMNTAKPENDSAINVDSLTEAWTTAWNTQDSLAIKEMLGDQSQVIFSANQRIVGSDKIMSDWVMPNLPMNRDLTISKIASDATGNMAYFTGAYKREIAVNDSIMQDESGSYTMIWKKLDDQNWKLEIMFFGHYIQE